MHGDPRTVMLIELARRVARRRKIVPTMFDAIEQGSDEFMIRPRAKFAPNPPLF